MRIPPALERVIGALARLPGVGEKTATRYAFHILAESRSFATDMSQAISELHAAVRHCEQCHNLSESDLCRVCRDPSRDHTRICVAEGIQDVIAIERTAEFRGRYHVLHGVLSPIRGIGPGELHLSDLPARIEADSVSEVIVATNVDVEGEATALYIQRMLRPFAQVRVTRIATGVPMGGELEYMDQLTLARALRDRRDL